MTYIKNNVNKPGMNKGVGGNKKDKITFFDFDDVATFPARDASGIKIIGNITMKPDAYMITVYGTIDTIKNNSESGGEIDAEGITQSVMFNHPGNEIEIREFRANWLSKNIGIIFEHCTDNSKDLYGSPCAPLRLGFKHDEDKDKNTTEFTLKSANKGPDVAIYSGNITYQSTSGTSVVSFVEPDATSIDLSYGPGIYQLFEGTTTSVEIIAATLGAHGMKFTLMGLGDTHPPTISTGGVFMLQDGAMWTASANHTISFETFQSGVDSFIHIETSRT